jgi:kinesin family protein C1
MSRLPRLHSSPDRIIAGPYIQSLKRKSIEEEEDEALDQPRKLPAIGIGGPIRPNRALKPSRTTPNLSKLAPVLPKPLTKPRAPPLTLSTTVRGTSAPPQSQTRRPSSRTASLTRATIGRTVSGPSKGTFSDDKRFNDLQTQLTSLDSARAADTARLASQMEAERAKVADLQENHAALTRELQAAKKHEVTQLRELSHASDELQELKKRHAREVADLELDIGKRDRELRGANEDLRLCRGDLEREREAVAALKGALAQQSTAHLTLTTQNSVMQAQMSAYEKMAAELTEKLVETETQVEEMKKEAMESELVRRKLHNMVQELKGNIRVFCRVRPILPSDLQSSTDGAELEAGFIFPDHRDHKDIVVSSSSESATGQERKEVYNFNFDRVGIFSVVFTSAHLLSGIRACCDSSRSLRGNLTTSTKLHGWVQRLHIRVWPDGLW